MAKVCNMASPSMGVTLEVKAYYTKIAKRLRVGLIHQNFHVVLSEDLFGNQFDNIRHHLDEFVVVPIGEIRMTAKEVKESGTFIDTGKRVQFNINLWGEVWRLQPEHLTLLQEKEAQDEKAENQSQCKPKLRYNITNPACS